MFCHWRYVLATSSARSGRCSRSGQRTSPSGSTKSGRRYACTAEDAAYGTFRLDDDVVAQFNSSWCTRVTATSSSSFQVDGTDGSAVAGLRACRVQAARDAARRLEPRPPDRDRFRRRWQEVPDNERLPNGFKASGSSFLRHVVLGEPFPWDFLDGARGIQLAELGMRSWAEGCLVDVPPLGL